MTRPSNTLILYLARGVRGFGDGFATVILPAYLLAIGYGPVEVGVVATGSLLGTALMTLAIGLVASRINPRLLLMAGAALMTLTGLAFADLRALALIVIAAFLGTINPTSGDLGVLVPLEHTLLARSASDATRTRAFARYSLIGALAAACGSLAAAAPDVVLARAGLSHVAALDTMFYAYAALGLVCMLLYRLLPQLRAPAAEHAAPLGRSRAIVFKLSALFSLDSFAGGFIAQSLLALWLFARFDLSVAAAGAFFFWSGLLSAFSYPIAARLSRAVGLVNTMVFTHVPSSLFLILAAFAPDLKVALGLLLARAALSQMDVPTRTSYVMAVVTPQERPAAAAFTAVPRSLAAAISPAFAGALFSGPFSGLPLVICGVLKIVYDAALLFSFRHLRAPEERTDEPAGGRPQQTKGM